MKRIYIARHAKSSSGYLGIKDIDRVLTERGILDAYLIADCFVKDKRKIPQVIYSSPAARAIHTAIIFSRVSGYVVDRIIINPFLYGATEHELITEIIKLDDKNTTVMFW